MFKPKSIDPRTAASRVQAVRNTLPLGDVRTAYRNIDNACYFNTSLVEEITNAIEYAEVTGFSVRPAMVY